MKVREMWDNESVPVGQRVRIKQNRQAALTHELKMLQNRQMQIYSQLKDEGVVLKPEETSYAIANRSEFIWISTIRHLGIPADFILPYSDKNTKTEQLFKKMNQRADTIRLQLPQTSDLRYRGV